jgi:hypothetical protein
VIAGCFPDSTAFPPPRYSTGFRCSSTATFAAPISTSGHRANIALPPSTTSTRFLSRNCRRMVSTRVRWLSQRWQLSGLAQALDSFSKANRNIRRADVGRSLRCRSKRGGLEAVRATPRLHQLQTQVPQGGWSLPFRSAPQPHRAAIPHCRGIPAGDHQALRGTRAGARSTTATEFSFSP